MGALSGLKVLDFSTLLPGPYATLMLADLGAEVLKISSPSKPDLVTEFPPYVEGTDATVNQAWLGRNKKSIFLNLKTSEGIALVKKLVLEYDILLEQFRPGVMDKLGLSYETLHTINPRLIYCSLTGYGQTGPLKMRAGHDINYLARSGNMSYAGKQELGPVLTNMQIADIAVGALNSVVGILAAVQSRHVTGKGQYVDVAMLDGLIPFHAMDGTAFLATGVEPKREGTRLNGGSMYDFYETADGRYLSVGSLEPQFWRNFCIKIGRESEIEGTVFPDDVAEVKERIRAVIRERTLQDWLTIFGESDVCVEPVLNLQEALLEDEHIQARNMVVDVEVPLSGGKRIKQLATAIKLSDCPISYEMAGYPPGYHTGEVLKKLGLDEGEVQQLQGKGVFS